MTDQARQIFEHSGQAAAASLGDDNEEGLFLGFSYETDSGAEGACMRLAKRLALTGVTNEPGIENIAGLLAVGLPEEKVRLVLVAVRDPEAAQAVAQLLERPARYQKSLKNLADGT